VRLVRELLAQNWNNQFLHQYCIAHKKQTNKRIPNEITSVLKLRHTGIRRDTPRRLRAASSLTMRTYSAYNFRHWEINIEQSCDASSLVDVRSPTSLVGVKIFTSSTTTTMRAFYAEYKE